MGKDFGWVRVMVLSVREGMGKGGWVSWKYICIVGGVVCEF